LIYAAKTPSIRGSIEEDVISNELLTCGVEECDHGVGWWYGYRLEARRRDDEWEIIIVVGRHCVGHVNNSWL